MPKYKIVIEETITGEFEVEADSAEEAARTAEANYHDGIFVLEPGECQKVKTAVYNDRGDLEKDFTEL